MITAHVLELLIEGYYVTTSPVWKEIMSRKFAPVYAFALCIAVAACDNDTVIERPDSVGLEESAAAFGEMRRNLDEVREGEPFVDPASANIDPFKYELAYSYEERDILIELLEEARADGDYLNRSLQATGETLELMSGDYALESYVEDLSCAASYDLAARNGVISANPGQVGAARMIRPYVDATAPASDDPDETALARIEREQFFEEELRRLRTRNYLNYFLIRDAMLAGSTGFEPPASCVIE